MWPNQIAPNQPAPRLSQGKVVRSGVRFGNGLESDKEDAFSKSGSATLPSRPASPASVVSAPPDIDLEPTILAGESLEAGSKIPALGKTKKLAPKSTLLTGDLFRMTPVKRLALAITLTSIVPFAATAFWLGGPLLGIGVGAPLSYASGVLGRRIKTGKDAEKINSTIVQIEEILKVAQTLGTQPPGELTRRLETMLGTGPEVAMIKSALETVGNSWFAKAGPLKWLMDLRHLDRPGTPASLAAKNLKRLNLFFKGLAVNMSVAKEDNPFKAAFAGLKGYLSVIFAGWVLAYEGVKILFDKFSGNEDKKPATRERTA